jgi:hypothetical protein
MAVGNLPNELPRESSVEFGEKLIEYIVDEMLTPETDLIERATIAKNGKLMPKFDYLRDYAKVANIAPEAAR